MAIRRDSAAKKKPPQEPKIHFTKTGEGNLNSNELLSRIYHHGFQLRTLPSVRRPNDVSNARPLSAKLYPIRKQREKEPIMLIPQPTVFHSGQEEDGDIYIDNEKTEESLIEENLEVLKSTKGRPGLTSANTYFSDKSRQNFHAPIGNKMQTEYLHTHQSAVSRTSSTPHLNRIRSAGGNSVGRLVGVGGKLGSTASSKLMKIPTRPVSGSSENLLSAFTEAELRRTKNLLDKVTGKYNIDKRYLEGGELREYEGTTNFREYEYMDLKNLHSPKNQTNDKIQSQFQKKISESPEQINQEGEDFLPRATSKLDKYIDLILKNVTNVDEFIYLQRNPENPDDPYDLIVINYSKITDNGISDYYTISKKGLCQYSFGKPTEFIVLAYWLKERDTYDRIKKLRFFKKFRKWKTVKMWKKIVIRKKINNSKEALDKKLFILNDLLRETLLAHRAECCDMEKLRFVEMNTAKFGVSSEIPTLESFKLLQEKKRKQIRIKIEEISMKCRENVRDGFKKCLDKLKKSYHTAAFEEDFARKNENQNFFRLKENAYENLGFPENMSYEKRSELRKECSKFIRFSYLLDFLAMESLKNIYLSSVYELITELEHMADIQEDTILKEKAQKQPLKNSREPLFNVNVEFNNQYIDEEKLIEVDLKEYVPPPFGKSEIKDFNILYHVKLRPPKVKKPKEEPKGGKKKKVEEESESEEEEEDKGLIDEDRIYNRLVVKDIAKIWLNVKPNIEAFFSDIMRCIGEGMSSIQAFERWNHHDEMTCYVSVLEEWDDMVGDNWEIPESNFLNPQDWLDQSPFEVSSGIIRNILEKAFARSDNYLNKFTPFLTIFWENLQINPDIFREETLAYPAESLKNALCLLEYQKEFLDREIPFQADLGLFRVNTNDLKTKLLPSPQLIIDNIKSFIPDLFRSRNLVIKEWIVKSIGQLKFVGANIEEFVNQQTALKEIEKLLPRVKSRVEVLNQFSFIMREFRFNYKKEDESALTETLQLQISLSHAISNVNDSTEKNKDGFKNKIEKHLIPDLLKNVKHLEIVVQDPKYLTEELNIDIAIKELNDREAECNQLEINAQKYNRYQRTLAMDETYFEDLDNVRQSLNLRSSMWKSLKEWNQLKEDWIEGKFVNIDTEEIRTKAEYYSKVVSKCNRGLPPNPVLEKLRESVSSFKNTMPVVIALKNQKLKEEHWADIKTLIKRPNFVIDENLTLKNLLDMNIYKWEKEIQEISTQATQEAVLEEQYFLQESKWKTLEFKVIGYKAEVVKDLFILTEVDELFGFLDELLANLSNIKGSRFIKRMLQKAEELHKTVLQGQEIIDDWLFCQKNWMYLENIFTSNIKKILPNESAQLEAVDKYFKQQMKKTFSTRLVCRCIPEISIFKKHKETLNAIEKALENLLEMKRGLFPRFYFLSNDELLEILAKASDLSNIQKHMKKCFDNIYKLDLGEDEKSQIIYGIISAEDERVPLYKHLPTKAEIEGWLKSLEDFMRETVQRKIKSAKKDLEEKERKIWVMEETHTAQSISVVAHLYWCYYTEFSILQISEEKNALLDWLTKNYYELNQLTILVREGLTPLKHRVVVALITQDVHSRDIIEQLVNENVSKPNDFLWSQQLRYYWEDKNEYIMIKQVNTVLNYGLEYMGATSRLVITPLTDRCWITITGALNIKLGAAPAGPAGTGKTESTKDLAKALGQFCVVFNCSDQIEYKMMERLFSGLAQQGAWACLDEFNRINIEVLSVIAQQLLTIRQALLKLDPLAPPLTTKFWYFGNEIPLHPSFGAFITMNPGYAGRTELPDNLKVLFRPVSMMIPDYGLIAEIMLFAEGFENAKPLSQKMVQLYKLSSEQLSQQRHYDFGMRAVKSVLVMAGTLKRANTTMNENVVLIRAMRDSNIPKFLKDDIPLFQALIQDLFPEDIIPESDYGDLETAINAGFDNLGLQKVPKLTTKVIQLFETFNVRFGVMLVGYTGSAKTTCYNLLQNAMNGLREKDHPDTRYQKINTDVMNPKAISMGELYGEINQSTQEWQDGLASEIMRRAASEEGNERRWIIFDGPVDALWIENMNTVLDDNMMLCLANGQRIKLRPQMKILFEVQDLAVASPATVSRCGIVYMTYEEIGWRPYVQSWIASKLQGLSPEMTKIIWQLFDDNIDDFLTNLRTNWSEPVPTVDIQLVIALCNIIEGFFGEKGRFNPEDKLEVRKRYINYTFAFSLIWSVCCTVNENQIDFVNEYFRRKMQLVLIPNSENIFGFYLDITLPEAGFRSWQELIPEFIYEKDIPYFNLLVQTSDSVKFSYMTEQLISNGKQVFVTGSTGTGKSVIIQALLNNMKEQKNVDPIPFIFSAQTSSIVTQASLESKLERYKKNLLGSKPGRKVAVFIDDINMPAVEEFGAQPPIELLRFMIDKGGLYDRKERFWKKIENTTLLACAAPPSGGRNELTPRFMRHFNLLCLPRPSYKTLYYIFEKILSGFLSFGFQEPIKKMSEFIVNASIEIYQRILKEKLPIPSKFHYTFNLRDVSKVFQGILMSKPTMIREPEIMIKLWINEVSRVFHDRLINTEDREWFNNTIIELLAKHFRSRWVYDEVFGQNTVMFGDLLRLDSAVREYEEIKDIKKLTIIMENKLDDYNSKYPAKMKLVFFSDALMHILRISRVLRQPRGNLMLIGVGGSGKQSLTKLSSFLLDLEILQLEITKGFGPEKFRDFIRDQIYKTGVEGIGVCFIVTDTQIVFESMLEDINNLLNSGEVPNIFEQDKKDHQEKREKIIKEVRQINIDLKRNNQPDVIYQTFVERVRNKFHIVLCMSPVGDALRVRCRKFPSLVDCCTLDWFSSWPESALVSVSSKVLADYNFPNDEIRTGVAEMCKEIHLSIEQEAIKFENMLKRKVYNTPKSYLDLINLYTMALNEKRDAVANNLKRLKSGITKLESSNKLVSELKIILVDLQPELELQSIKVEEALKILEKETKIATEKQTLVSKDKLEAEMKKSEIELITKEAQDEFDKVKPELDRAEKAVQEIDKPSLVQMRSYTQPPKVVETVMEGVCILFGKKFDWPTAKSMMLDLNLFISNLLTYPRDNIPEDRLKKIKKHAQNPEFNPEELQNRAPAAADLCTWCLSILLYSKVSKDVAPKKKKMQELQLQLDEEIKNLAIKQEELDRVEANVSKLKKDSEEMVSRKEELANRINLTKARLERAEKLTHLLAEEGQRWVISIKNLEIDLHNIIGDVFLSSACTSYLGPFTGQFRQDLLHRWTQQVQEKNISISENFSIAKTIGDSLELRDWNADGLPSDQVSIENALFATKGSRWPLLIDPQQQANKWIKRTEKEKGLKVLKFTDQYYQIDLRAAINSGYTALIQDVEETLDPLLDSVLAKQITDENGRKLVRFGDLNIDYHPSFRLYLTTKLPNPHYLPEVFIKVSIINFTVTFSGLEEQLLADVVKNERPEIEQKRDENIVNLARYIRKIAESENMILKLLNDSNSETLLDNVELIRTLEVSKITSEEVKIKMQEGIELEKTIEETRNKYKSVSIRGSILYFVIKDLSLIDPMYQYSLQYISRLFNLAMKSSEENKDISKRINILIENVTKSIYTNVCRGLFEAHKLIFSFLIATSIKKQSGELSEAYWSILLRGPPVFDKSSRPNNPDKNLISDISWDLAFYLELTFSPFKGFTKHIIDNFPSWKEYINCSDPIKKILPGEWKDKLNLVEKMLIIKVFRQQKIMFALSDYVQKILGSFYLESPSVSMQSIYNDSDVKTPVIFVLSQGADPTQNLLNFARDRDFGRLKTISLGQGQEKIATKYIEDGIREGNWVLLQNCHLSKSFMPKLEMIVDTFAGIEPSINQEFRLFLTSMPESYFPVSILQNGIKLTTEPPRGVKANLKRSFNEITDEFLDSCNQKEKFHKLLFGLCFFHAIIQERRKFGPLGWNIRYEFNDSDLDTSKTVLMMFLNEQSDIPWDALLFVTGHINYGGRVTDDLDRRCLLAILKRFYSEKILEDKYQFSASPQYIIPPLGTVENYNYYISSLPISDDPECFGMHENANINFQAQESEKMIATILSIQPRIGAVGTGKTSDETVLELARKILEEIPLLLDKDKGQKDLYVLNELNLIPSLSTVLLQEIERFNTLLGKMTATLKSLDKAIQGLSIMSQELDAMYYSLLNNQVPSNWEKVAYPSLKPLASWMRDLNARVKFMEEWLLNGNPLCFWISGFYFPQGFLTGVLQTHARKNKIAIDKLKFTFKIMEGDKDSPLLLKIIEGVFVYGFLSEGATWDKKKKYLVDQNQNEMYSQMPVILFTPTDKYEKKPNEFQCPVYKTSLRAGVLSTTGQSTNFILLIDVPTNDENTDIWTLRGTAMLTQLND